MTSFLRLTPERPNVSSHVALLFEPATERTLLIVDGDPQQPRADASTEVWSLGPTSWTRVASGLFPRPSKHTRHAGPPVAWIDPASGEAIVGRLASDGLRTLRLSRPSELIHHVHAFADEHADEAHAVWHPRLAKPLLWRCGSNDAQLFAVESTRLVELGAVPYVHALAVDETTQDAVGYDVHGTVHAFDGVRCRALGAAPNLQGLSWHPAYRALVTLLPREGSMALAAWDGSKFAFVEPAVTTPGAVYGGRLLVTPTTIVYCGGQRFAGAPTNATLRCELREARLEALDVEEASFDEYTTAITTRSRLLLVDPSRCAAVDASARRASFELCDQFADGPRLDRRFLNFAASDEDVFMLDAAGEAWSAPFGERLRRIARAAPGPGVHYAHRVAIAWDPPSRRLVVFGGVESNATWSLRPSDGAFEELRPLAPPPHGIGSAVSTPLGVYLLISGELYRFVDDRWQASRCTCRGIACSSIRSASAS